MGETCAIGFVECKFIAAGCAIADEMLKAADVQLQFARKNCPGRLQILVTGDVASVSAAVDMALLQSEKVVDYVVLPRVDRRVTDAFFKTVHIDTTKALGIMEYSHVVSAVAAADKAVKAADVVLLGLNDGRGTNGKSYFVLSGELSAVEAALDAAAVVQTKGKLLSRAVIPHPHPSLHIFL